MLLLFAVVRDHLHSRGMWANYVLNALGLPPTSSSRLDHMRWWWRAHNMVSEHAANSRGGHPW